MMRQRVDQTRGKRHAFTLIELVMVIVVLGIVSMIATDIIASMYKGYIQSKIVNELESKTELVVNQVAKRLNFRIKPTMIARSSTTNANFIALNSPDLNDTSKDYDMVEWIGSDYESFLGSYNGTFFHPGWSGFIDLNSSITSNTTGFFSTPGSNLNTADSTMQALSNNHVSLSGAHNPAIIFKCAQAKSDMSLYGWDPAKTNVSDHNYTLIVKKHNATVLELNATQQDVNRSICEQYNLAWSAYALVPEGADPDDFNLTLKYDYQPWYGESYKNGESAVLAEHVSTFRVMQLGETLRIKICIQDGNTTGEPVGFCKEKAIF